MKRIFFPLLILLLALPVVAGVGPSSSPQAPAYVEPDQAKVDEAFSDLDALERLLESRPDATLSGLQSEGNPLVADAEMVNGLGVANALADGDGWAIWLIILIVLGGLAVVGCCVMLLIYAASYY